MTIKSFHYLMSALVTLAAVVFCVAAPQAASQSKDEQELTALVKQMTDAQAKFDPATLDKIYTSDFIEISPIGEVDPRDKTIGFYKPEAKPPGDQMSVSVTTDEFLNRNYGNFAIVIARLTYAPMGVAPAARPPFSIRVTLVCRKEKGVWKIASSQYTGIRPPRPAQ
ncbi:MAG TPA: nuclear transport factor 2 family protein [Pyrinomonadaceae bacterium]|nr:nuclear transport factor 2 family protein [Pyrinomonadaceae bacterium]